MLFGKYASRKSEAKYPTLWTGLDHVWAPCVTSPSGNSFWDLGGRNNHGTSSGLVGTDWDRALGFSSLNYDGTDNYTAMARRVFSGRSVFSVMLWARMTATTHILEIGEGDSNTVRMGFGLANDGNCYLLNSTAAPVQNFCFANWSSLGTSDLICAIGVYDPIQSSLANRAVIYLQGASRSLSYSGIGSMTGNVPTYSTAVTQVGRRPTNDNYATGRLLACAVWGRALRPEEALLAHKIGPTGLFKPKQRSYFGASSGLTFRRSLSNRIGSRSLN